MILRRARTLAAVFVCLFLALVAPMRGMIFYSTASTTHNTSAPTGVYADSGWQWVGTWGGFQGVVVGPHHFLAADHVGGAPGNLFNLGGTDYTAVGYEKDSSTDMRIWKVEGRFPSWAPLYDQSDEVGRLVVAFGRGFTRGAEVRTVLDYRHLWSGYPPPNTLVGWKYGGGYGQLRWGTNMVSSVSGASFSCTFDAVAPTEHECHLATGDSSGPVFILDTLAEVPEWKLAGIAVGVDAVFSTTLSNPLPPKTDGFMAALSDMRGVLYWPPTVNNWGYVGGPDPMPSRFYCVRISERLTWILDKLNNTLPSTISVSDLTHTYDGASHAARVTTNPAGLATTVTYAGSPTPPTAAGSYAVVATITASGYEPAVATGTLVIAKAAQTITFPTPPGATYGDGPVALTASASSGLPVSFASNNTEVATILGPSAQIIGAGTTIITATQPGNENYLAATGVNQTLLVAKAAQSISFAPLEARTVGDGPFTLTATASSGLPVTFSSDNTAVATVSGNQATIVGAGQATITATQGGNSNFDAESVGQTLTVNAASSGGSNSHAVPAAPAWALFGAGVLLVLTARLAAHRQRTA